VPVTYLVAADREWVSESFQHEYGDLGPAMGRPGRPLGSLFLAKTFAVSAPLPRPSAAAQEVYWRAVLAGGDQQLAPIKEADRTGARDELADISVEEAISRVADLGSDDVSGRARALREKAAIKMAETVTGGGHDHVLAPYLVLLEQNPRALKRLRNAYAIATMGRFASLDIATSPRDVDALIRWTILALRWPQLAYRIVEQPSVLGRLVHRDINALGNGLDRLVDDDDLGRLLREPVGDITPELDAWVEAEFDTRTG
jgi:hypothetical protein